jgi:hypothetical protein
MERLKLEIWWVGVMFLYLAAAAIVALSELNGIATERQYWRKAQAATELL